MTLIDKNTSIALIGECMVELSNAGGGTLKAGFGGDVLNTAVYLKRLAGDQADVRFATILGEDPFADEMLSAWENEGLCLDAVGRMAGRTTGLYLIETDDDGDRTFHYWRGEAPARDIMRPDWSWIMDKAISSDWIYFSGITLAILSDDCRRRLLDGVTAAAAKGTRVAFDGNYRARLWKDADEAAHWFEQAWRSCTLALAGVDDEQDVFGDHDASATMDRLQSYGLDEVLLKRAAAPILIQVAEQSFSVDTVAPQQIVDTTAAGDSFNGGYLAARMLGKAPEEAARIAGGLAAEVIGHPGAIIPKAAMAHFQDQVTA